MKVIIYKKSTKEFVTKIKEKVIEGKFGTYFSYETEYTKDLGKAKIFDKLPLESSGGWWNDHAKLIIEK